MAVFLHTALPFERFGPLPLFSLAGLWDLQGEWWELGWMVFVPVTRFLLARGRRDWLSFGLAGIVYAFATTMGVVLVIVASTELGGLAGLIVLALLTAILSGIFIPANLIYWALAIHPGTLGVWQRICGGGTGREAKRGA
ncbi:hypothetical protein [Breoghania sp.]|uniref:hypothetical protein n=1 Tax=Breoghania sp. TaxID=2065378 RepID=UPI00261818B8|nr:hypothetical protein [Breoghania sp.]MDJ0931891.1 hypothetical protein [Breoghania sp.]